MQGNPVSTHPLTLHSSSCQSRQKTRDRDSKERRRANRVGGGRLHVSHLCLCPTTEMLCLESTRRAREIERRKIKNVKDSGKPVVVFSTNCKCSFVFILPCIILITALNAYMCTKWAAHGGEWPRKERRKKGQDIKQRGQIVRWWLLSSSPLSELAPACFASSSSWINEILLWIMPHIAPLEWSHHFLIPPCPGLIRHSLPNICPIVRIYCPVFWLLQAAPVSQSPFTHIAPRLLTG